MRILKLIIFIGFAAATLGAAQAYTFPGRPNCPQSAEARKANITWRQYISLKASPKGFNGGAPFDVRFDHSAHLHDKKAGNGPFGNIFAGSCYTVDYEGNLRWHAAGFNKAAKETKFDVSNGGNPLTYRINIWGRIFTYDRTGALFDAKYGRVGTLYCDLSNQCTQYADPDLPPPAHGPFTGQSIKYPLGKNSDLSNAGPNINKAVNKASGQVFNPSIGGCRIHGIPPHC